MIVEIAVGTLVPTVMGIIYKAGDVLARLAVVEAKVAGQEDDIKYIRGRVDKILEEMKVR